MTTVYFVRHAKPDFSIHDDLTRPLTKEGLQDSKRMTDFLIDKQIDHVYSSPYLRAIDTIKDFAKRAQLHIKLVEDFRERKVSDEWIEDFDGFAKMQWQDWDYRLPDGESLNQVQRRNVAALRELINQHPNQNIVIGTHGTSMSAMLNYFDHHFDYQFFNRIKHEMPLIICAKFNGENLVDVEEFTINELN